MSDTIYQSVDSKSDEWIVDGDLYLIKTISRYPILWDRKNFDSDLRNEVWLKLSKKLKIKLEWMKKRWSYLREQYVRHLKQLNNVEYDKPSKKNYKYFDEMSFLANHVQIRNGNYQLISNIYKSANITKNRMVTDDKDDDDDDGAENVDFVITENEIEAYNDDDDDLADNLFVELSDDEKDEQMHPNPNDDNFCNSDTNSTSIQKPIPTHDNKPELDSTAKTSPLVFVEVNSLELRTADQQSTEAVVNEKTKDIPRTAPKTPEERCEDVIFGELVTSMLKKMDSQNRKRAKKEILNILLS